MKTTYTTKQAFNGYFQRLAAHVSSRFTASAAVFFLAVACCSDGFSQEMKTQPQLNMGVDTYISGNGHGAFYSGYVGVSMGRHILNVGPCIQARSMEMKGGRICYSYILTGYEDKNSLTGLLDNNEQSIQLRFFSYAQYVDQLGLSNSAISKEEKLNSNERDWKSLRFSTVEAGAGISLNIRMSKRVYWRNTIAISTYYHVSYPEKMFHERSALMLTLGTGFNIPSF